MKTKPRKRTAAVRAMNAIMLHAEGSERRPRMSDARRWSYALDVLADLSQSKPKPILPTSLEYGALIVKLYAALNMKRTHFITETLPTREECNTVLRNAAQVLESIASGQMKNSSLLAGETAKQVRKFLEPESIDLVTEFARWREQAQAELVRSVGPWTASDSRKATREGWDLFECSGGDWNGLYMLQADSDNDRFAGDEQALDHVRDLARAGSALHIKALCRDGTEVES